jgi:hypothetical protein
LPTGDAPFMLERSAGNDRGWYWGRSDYRSAPTCRFRGKCRSYALIWRWSNSGWVTDCELSFMLMMLHSTCQFRCCRYSPWLRTRSSTVSPQARNLDTFALGLAQQPNELRISVENSGTNGPGGTSGTGVGLRNVRRRLEICYGSGANLDLVIDDQKATAEISIPITAVAAHSESLRK